MRDITGISNYIALRSVDAAVSTLNRVEETCQLLAENPGLGEVRTGFGVPGCRSFTVSRYVIFFRPNEHGIEVARVLDGSRDL